MDERVGRILLDALRDAERRGGDASRGWMTCLRAIATTWTGATLAFLGSRRYSPSPYPGWRQVRGFDAGVLRWWNDHLGGPFPSTTTSRLQTLRGDIYDFLDELGRIVRARSEFSCSSGATRCISRAFTV